MEKKSYYAAFFLDDGTWSYTFPGMSTSGLGRDFDDAMKLAAGSLAFTLECLVDEGKEIPEPMTKDDAVAFAIEETKELGHEEWRVELIEPKKDWKEG